MIEVILKKICSQPYFELGCEKYSKLNLIYYSQRSQAYYLQDKGTSIGTKYCHIHKSYAFDPETRQAFYRGAGFYISRDTLHAANDFVYSILKTHIQRLYDDQISH